MAVTAIADVIVPDIFTRYTQQLTAVKSRLIQSGVLESSELLNEFLTGGGLTINMPSWRDLANDAENISTDVTGTSTPKKITAANEITVRLSRNQSWATADLAEALAGEDPADAIANRVANYWAMRLQSVFIATMQGVFADNAAAPTGTEHVQNDLTFDIKGASFTNGVTNFSAEALIDATLTMGDSFDELRAIMVHSVVFGRMQKNNLIDTVPDSEGNITIPTFLGRRVIVDDGMPFASGVYETWLFGQGAVRFGRGSPKVPTETKRYPEEGNGGGQEALFNRVEWALNPSGTSFVATPANGGPSNASTSGNLAHADSWLRVASERKQIKIARLITRES